MPNRIALSVPCAALTLVLAGPAQTATQPSEPTQPSAPTEVSALTVVASKPTPVSALTVSARRTKPLSGLTVGMPRKCLEARRPADPDIPAPRLVSTYPANGAVVRPGIVVLRLTFDLPMACAGLIGAHAPLKNPCPAPLRDPVISRDKRTFLTVCAVQKGRHYGLWLGDNDHLRFTSLAGHSLKRQELLFETSDDVEVASLGEAMMQDQGMQEVLAKNTQTADLR
jgi:hypothetical protein